MSIEMTAALIPQFVPETTGYSDRSEVTGRPVKSRGGNGVERISRHSKSDSTLAVVDQALDQNQTPEAALAIFRRSMLENFPSLESPLTIVTALLSQCYPTDTAANYALVLLDKFGSIGGLLRKSAEDIGRICPMRTDAIFLLKTINRTITAALREPVENRPVIGSSSALEAYLKFTMADEHIETVRTLFLNRQNFLIKDEVHSTGTINGVTVSAREIARRILDLGATGLIIVHNHPSGDPTPSATDIEFTGLLKKFLDTISVSLQDSVIIGRNRMFSFRAAELLQ